MKKLFTFLVCVCLYHVGFAQWVNLDSLPGIRASGATFTIGDTAGYFVAGGCTGCGGSGYNTEVWKYNMASNTWTSLAPFPDGHDNSPVGFAIGDTGYVGTGAEGGYNYSNSFYKYDPNTNTWTPIANMPVQGPAPGRCSGVSFVINGKGYVGGGLNSLLTNNGNNNPHNDFFVYDPATGWDSIALCPAKGIGVNAVAFALNGKGYVGTGGQYPAGSQTWTPQSDFWAYDPTTNTWDSIAPVPGGGRMGAVAFATCSKGYVGTGVADAAQQQYLSDFYEYDPTNGPLGTWTRIADYGGAGRYKPVSFVAGNHGYVVGGFMPFFVTGSALWEYVPTYTPAFSADSTVCQGQSVSFTDTSNYGPTNWLWSFPGGTPNSSTQQNPVITYDTAGVWNVTLTAFSACDSGTRVFNNYITVSAAGSALTISPPSASVCTGTNITLTVGGGINITWSPSTGLNTSSGDTVIATPLSTTTYTATNGSANCVASQQVVVTIVPADTAGIAAAARDTICQNTRGTINLTGNNSNVLQWQSSLTNSNFANINGADTTFYVTDPLAQSTCYRVMVGTGSCTAISDTVCLFVPPALTASFNFTVSGGNNVTFNADSSVGNIVTYSWTFGDGSGSTLKNPSHPYPKTDTTYNACLTIYDGSNCSYTFCKDVPLFTGIAAVASLGDIQVYPNPVGSKLMVIGYSLLGRELVVTDVLGRTLLAEKVANNQATIDVSNLSSGIYLIEVRSEAGTVVKKFVKE